MSSSSAPSATVFEMIFPDQRTLGLHVLPLRLNFSSYALQLPTTQVFGCQVTRSCYVDKRCPGLKEEVSTSQARRRTLRCRGKRQICCLAKQRVRWWDPRGWTWLSIVTLSREVRQSINPTVHWLYSPHSLYQSCHVSSYHRWHSLSLISFNNLTYIHLFVHDKCMTGIDDLHNHHRSHSNTAHTKVTLGCISRRHLSPLYMPITML